MEQEELMYTVEEVAQILKASVGHIRRLIKAGLLRAVNVGIHGRPSLRVPASAVQELKDREG